MLMKIFKTYNEGQYGLKPWAANLIMLILEIILVLAWFFAMIGSIMYAMGKLDLSADDAEPLFVMGDIVLPILLLVWNLLVWFIKPLRTKFNYKESIANVVFIILSFINF